MLGKKKNFWSKKNLNKNFEKEKIRIFGQKKFVSKNLSAKNCG